jgi:protein phosphatase
LVKERGGTEKMLASTVATLQDNSTHGEDSYLVRDLGNNAFLDVVLDGVTGHGGEEASRSVAEALESASISSIEDVIAILEDQNEEFFQVGGGRFLLTTVSAALFLGEKLYVISAGDSPAYHIKSGSHEQLAGRIGGLLRGGSTRVIGSEQELTLNRTELSVEPGDRLVLATDGVSDNLETDKLVDMVRQAASPEEASTQVKDIVAQRLEQGFAPTALGGRFRHDDQTAIFRFFGG